MADTIRMGSHDNSPAKTRSGELLSGNADDKDVSPLKHLQRMKETGTIRILPKHRYGTGRRRKSSGAILDFKSGEDLRHVNSLKDMRKCGSESPKVLPDKDKEMNDNIQSFYSLRRPTSPNNNSMITGEGDVTGASEGLVRSDTNGNVRLGSKDTSQPDIVQEADPVPGPELVTPPGANTVVVEDKNANVTVTTLTLERRRSITVAPITLPGAETPETLRKGQQGSLQGTLKRDISPSKVTEMNVLNMTFTTIPKPVIEVKLVKKDRSLPTTPRSRHSTPRSTPPRVMYPRDPPTDANPQRISKSVDDLDKDETKPEDVIYCSTNLLRDVKHRHSFVDRNRDSVYNSIGEMNTLLKSDAPDEEKVYSLPQPQCYSESTLKAVKQITEKYDTLQRRKMRAMSFRENSKFSPVEPGSPITQAALWNLKVETIPGPVVSADVPVTSEPVKESEVKTQKEEPVVPDCPFVDTLDNVVCAASGITRRDISRIDLFYRGRETEVIVCSCLVDMRMGMPGGDGVVSTWEHLYTGVPVFVLNTGLWKRRRELTIILADRETGFPLWQDKITYLTNYKVVAPNLHTMHVSNQLRKMVGLTFYCEGAAAEFLARFRQITSDPNDDLWKVSTGRGDKKKKLKKIKFKKPNKKDISQPCNFAHITRVDPGDHSLYDSFQNLGGPGSPARREFARPRLQTA